MNVIELITRLRYSRYEHDNGIGDEAADALEAQAREIADLSANLERLQQRWATRPVTDDLQARLAELEAERTGTIHESWQHKTHAELLEGLKWQGAITKSLLASNDELQAWLVEAKGLLEEIGDEWPAVKRTTVERAYAFIERAADSAEPREDAAHG